MAAIIRSFRNGITPITGASRGDLESTDIVLLTAVDAHTTYSWVLAFAPAGSAATFTGTATSSSPGSFTVDVEGSYLIKLTVDAGLGTEDEQFVRLRALTSFGELRLVAAGERRDSGGIIPVDVDVEGWANDQNFNLVRLNNFVKPMVSSGRLLYVDANDGTDSYGDQALVQAAIDQADGVGASESEQWIVAVRPGVYIEDLTFKPWIHVLGWPGNPDGLTSEAVILRTATATGHVAAVPGASDRVLVSDLHLESTGVTANATLQKTGSGHVHLHRCRVEQNGVSAGQGSAFDLQAGFAHITSSGIQHTDSGASDRMGLTQTGATTTLFVQDSTVVGPSGLSLNPTLVVDQAAEFLRSRIEGNNAAGAGFTSSAQSVLINACVIEVPAGAAASAVLIHPSGGALVGNMDVSLKYSTVAGDISYETTGVAGTEDLNLGAVEYRAITFPGPAPTQTALVQSESHFYDNTISGMLAENVQDAIDELASVAAIAPVVYHKNMPGVPDDTVRYRGWAPVNCELLFVRVYIQSKGSSSGTYELRITNEATGNPVLLSVPFDMYSVVDATVTAVPLTATASDLLFAAQDAWTVELTSDDPGFDADSIYVSLVFNTASGAGALVSDWATSLAVGNISGGRNPTISANDVVEFESSPAAAVSPANTGRIRYNQSTTTFEVSLDGAAWRDLDPNDDHQFEVSVAPGLSIEHSFLAPYDLTVVAIKVRVGVQAVTAGVYTLAVEDADLSNNLLGGATEDLEPLVSNSLTTLSLTGTAVDLDLAAGTRVTFTFVSDNGDLTASGLYVQMLYRSR